MKNKTKTTKTIDEIVELLKPFRGSRLDYIRKNLPTRSETEYKRLTRGMNGTVFDNLVSMLYNGYYNLITAKGPDFGNIELKLATLKEDCNFKGDISICDIKDECYDDSNFKKKTENLMIVVCIGKAGKNAKEDVTTCFVDILILNENLRDHFDDQMRKSYEIQRERFLRGKTSGTSKLYGGSLGLLKLSKKNLQLTNKAVKHFFVSSYEENTIGTSKFLFDLEEKSSGVFNSFPQWLKIYKNPISLEEFLVLLRNTSGFKQMTSQHKDLGIYKEGDIMKPRPGAWLSFVIIDGAFLVRETMPGNFKDEVKIQKDMEFFIPNPKNYDFDD